jgi:hypothetical protein
MELGANSKLPYGPISGAAQPAASVQRHYGMQSTIGVQRYRYAAGANLEHVIGEGMPKNECLLGCFGLGGRVVVDNELRRL